MCGLHEAAFALGHREALHEGNRRSRPHQLAQKCFPHLPLAEDTEGASGTPNNSHWQAIPSAGSLPRADYLQKGLPSHLLLWVDQEDFTNKLGLCLKSTFSNSMVIFILGSLVAFRFTTAYQVRMFNNNMGRTSATGASSCFFKELIRPICPDGM